ncbi:MAG: caspase family protein, partial [Vicinamibacterales bacterium]
MPPILRLLTAILAALLWPTGGEARAETRVALVIGNSAYRHAPALANPKNDASAVAEALAQLGFTVLTGIDLDRTATEHKLREFGRQLAGAEAGLFYYAGHGLQVDGKNYIVPIDAELTDETDLPFEAVDLSVVMSLLEREQRTNLVFLDACRDNPLAQNLARAMGAARSTAIG